jgi:AAA domain
MLLAAPTGVGKSTWALQAMLLWAVGRECLGFIPARPLKSVYFQSENDDGDIAELREGIFKGLNFGEQERAEALANVQILTVDDMCGTDFLHKIVEPACRDLHPDLIWIDPLFAYAGGDTGRAEVMSPWLRNHLNPILHRYAVGCIIIHHTNKPPTGKEKATWQAGDLAYLGSGSVELANWPRAVVGIRSVGSHHVFELVLGKRGSRAHWRNEDGTTAYSRFIAHGDDGIYWREAREDEIPTTGRKPSNSVEDIMEVLGKGEMTVSEWQELCKTEYGISERSFYRLKKDAATKKLISQSQISKKWFKKR